MLAVRELTFERVGFLCSVFVIAGVIMPLFVLSGVRGGIYTALLDELASDPNLLRIVTTADHAFDEADAEEIRAWPGVAFVALRTRSIVDEAKVRVVGEGRIRSVTMVASGADDPLLPEGGRVDAEHVAISQRAAGQIKASPGQQIELISTSQARRTPLIMALTVSAVVPRERLPGNVLLTDPHLMDEIEAYYEGYANPGRGLVEGRDPATRVSQFEGVRIFADRLESVVAVDERLGSEYEVGTVSKAGEIARTLALGRNLRLALNLITISAFVGLAAALLSDFYASTERKRVTYAMLALMGQSQRTIAWIPVVQAAVVGACGVMLAVLLTWGVATLFNTYFATQIVGAGRKIVQLPVADGIAIATGVLVVISIVSAFGVRIALRTDPAIVLRSE